MRKKIIVLILFQIFCAAVLAAQAITTVIPDINRKFDDYNWIHRHERILKRV